MTTGNEAVGLECPHPSNLAAILLVSIAISIGITVTIANANGKTEGCQQDVVFSAREIERTPADAELWDSEYDPDEYITFGTSGDPGLEGRDGHYDPLLTGIDSEVLLDWKGTHEPR